MKQPVGAARDRQSQARSRAIKSIKMAKRTLTNNVLTGRCSNVQRKSCLLPMIVLIVAGGLAATSAWPAFILAVSRLVSLVLIDEALRRLLYSKARSDQRRLGSCHSLFGISRRTLLKHLQPLFNGIASPADGILKGPARARFRNYLQKVISHDATQRAGLNMDAIRQMSEMDGQQKKLQQHQSVDTRCGGQGSTTTRRAARSCIRQ